jgi:hypothetical protein
METGKNNQTLSKSEEHLCDIPWFTRMEQDHKKALGLFKNILTSNGYLSFEAAFSDIEKSYGMFTEFLENQGVKFSNTIKNNKSSMESVIEIGLKNMELRLKIA